MNELQIFNNPDFGDIRIAKVGNEPWFIGKDVAEALGYTNPRKALSDHVEDEDKVVTKCDTPGGIQHMTAINESGLYSLILSSKLPTSRNFKKWVTSEVIPSIRQNGGYIAGQEELSEQELMAKALMVAQKTLERRDEENRFLKAENERMKPKEIFADAIMSSSTNIKIGELAKILNQNGIDIGQNRLFKWLRANDYLMDENIPTQKAVNLKIFFIDYKPVPINGEIVMKPTTKVTPKG